MTMSRPNMGVEHVDRLSGDAQSKARLKTILLVLQGELSVDVASERLGISPSRFHELRETALCGALEAIAPRPAGRPARSQVKDARIAELEDELDDARMQIEIERVRSELAVLMPEVMRGKTRPPHLWRRGRGGGSKRTKS
jgi:hypothetical protein